MESNIKAQKIGPVFIVGNSRSGTTLMARMLNKHKDVYILNETHFFQTITDDYIANIDRHGILKLLEKIEVIQKYGIYRHGANLKTPSILVEAYEDKKIKTNNKYNIFNDTLRVIARSKGRYIAGDQTPQSIFYIDELMRAYPSIRIINMVRDPRAVALSQKRKWKASLELKQPKKEVVRAFFNYHPITFSILWNKAIRASVKAEEQCSEKNYRTVIFEELISNTPEKIKSICAFIGISYESNMINISIEGSSNTQYLNDKSYSETGSKPNMNDLWKKKLNSADIFIIQKLTKEGMRYYRYKNMDVGLSLSILLKFIYFPIHLIFSYILNVDRIGNPVNYIKKRLT